MNDTSGRQHVNNQTRTKPSESGFSYIDVMVAMMIMIIAILALTGALATAVVRSKEAEQRILAKHHVNSGLESILSVSDIKALGWDALGNVGQNVVDGLPKGKFLAGEQPIYSASLTDTVTDGIIGTADDATAPGAQVIPGFRRTVTITDICDPERPSANCPTPGPLPVMLRRVEVVVTYPVNRLTRTERVVTIIANYR